MIISNSLVGGLLGNPGGGNSTPSSNSSNDAGQSGSSSGAGGASGSSSNNAAGGNSAAPAPAPAAQNGAANGQGGSHSGGAGAGRSYDAPGLARAGGYSAASRTDSYTPGIARDYSPRAADTDADREAAMNMHATARIMALVATIRQVDDVSAYSLFDRATDETDAYRHAASAYSENSE